MLCDLTANPGVGSNIFSALVYGGTNYGETKFPAYLVSLSTRGYSGNQDDILKHVNVQFIGPGPIQDSVAFLIRNNGARVELWMRFSTYPYPAAMQVFMANWVNILPSRPQEACPSNITIVPIVTAFTSINKPTPPDVGLGLVNNFPIATTLEDGSQAKYATAALTYQLAHLLALHAAGDNHPAGTTTEKGMLRLATTEEAIAGQRADCAVAPKQMRDAMEAMFDIICPIGQLIYYDGPTVPNERFIVYKAQSFDPVRYPKLAKKWPSGRLPADLRSEFIRGADEGRGIVAGLLPMMSKPDQIRSHAHLIRKGYDRTNPGGGNYIQPNEECVIFGKGFSSPTPDYDHSAGNGFHSDVTTTGGTETTPRYVGALILCRCE